MVVDADDISCSSNNGTVNEFVIIRIGRDEIKAKSGIDTIQVGTKLFCIGYHLTFSGKGIAESENNRIFAEQSVRKALSYWNKRSVMLVLASRNVRNFYCDASTVIAVRAYSVDWLLHLHHRVFLTTST